MNTINKDFIKLMAIIGFAMTVTGVVYLIFVSYSTETLINKQIFHLTSLENKLANTESIEIFKKLYKEDSVSVDVSARKNWKLNKSYKLKTHEELALESSKEILLTFKIKNDINDPVFERILTTSKSDTESVILHIVKYIDLSIKTQEIYNYYGSFVLLKNVYDYGCRENIDSKLIEKLAIILNKYYEILR